MFRFLDYLYCMTGFHEIDGEEVTAMVYIMNFRMQFGLLSPSYYQTVYEGYKDCELDTDVLG